MKGSTEGDRRNVGRFYHAHPFVDWLATEWRPRRRVASRRRRRDDVPPTCPPVTVLDDELSVPSRDVAAREFFGEDGTARPVRL